MEYSSWFTLRRGFAVLTMLATVLVVACGGSSTSTPIPAAPTSGAGTSVPVATVAPTSAPSGGVATGKDSITLVIGGQPSTLDSLGFAGGISASINYDNLADPLTWQSGDDQRIVPTTATTGWEQLAPNKWRFNLREGVKFHNGEAWNAQAALPSIEISSSPENDNLSYPYTGGFTAEAVNEYTLDLTCAADCPIFPQTAFFMNFDAPGHLASTTEEERTRQNVSFGPYKLVNWDFGVSITMERYDDYVPAGDHFEFQKGTIRDVTWLFRGEAQVMTAMIKANEADMAWDVGVDVIDALPPEQIKSGGSAELFTLDVLNVFGGETTKLKVRQAMEHAVNCQELIDSLYGGNSVCRGNIIWPGVNGATERNTAPYTYDPAMSRQLLEEANYDFDTKMRIVSRGTRIPKQVEVLEAIQGYLSDVGIDADIQVVEVQPFIEFRNCRAGQAVTDYLASVGKDISTDDASMADYRAAMAAADERGSASCATAELIENEPSNETLDFARQAFFYLNCAKIQSPNCDPSEGGIQSKVLPASEASGQERIDLLTELADYVHDQALWLSPFDLPVFYAVNPKLNWTPRFDRRVRINAMSFSD